MATWFRNIYIGAGDKALWFPFIELDEYEVTYQYHLLDPLADDESSDIMAVLVTPTILLTGLAYGRGGLKLSYEFYHPCVVARQLGFGQVPPKLSYIGELKYRYELPKIAVELAIRIGHEVPIGNSGRIKTRSSLFCSGPSVVVFLEHTSLSRWIDRIPS